ncbi:hypothetical protein QW131_03535 [Roseibium salinum]|nr:hypothetical protein [Roseibium salinum]
MSGVENVTQLPQDILPNTLVSAINWCIVKISYARIARTAGAASPLKKLLAAPNV